MAEADQPVSPHDSDLGRPDNGTNRLSARPTRVRLIVLVLACILSFTLYLHRYAWGFIKKDVQHEFMWDTVKLGWLDSLFLASYSLGQVPSGIICDRFGARLLLGGSAIIWSLALAAIVMAKGIVMMGFARLAFGAAQASCYPALSKVTKNWFPLEARPTAQTLIASLFGRCGGAASFLIFGVFLGTLSLSWRSSVLLLASLGVASGILFLLLFRNTPREHPWANQAEADLVASDDPEARYAARSRLQWKALWRSPSVLLLFARALASNMADTLYVYWLPLYLLGVMQVDIARAGWMAALPLLGGAAGGTVSGLVQSYLIRRTKSRRWARSGVGLAGKLLAALLMLVAGLGLETVEIMAGLFLAVKFFSDWEQPSEWGAATDLGGRSAATVFACVNTAGALGGVVSGPLIGLVLRAYSNDGMPTSEGWNAVFIVSAVEYLAAAACWLGIDCSKPLASFEEPA